MVFYTICPGYNHHNMFMRRLIFVICLLHFLILQAMDFRQLCNGSDHVCEALLDTEHSGSHDKMVCICV